MTTVELSGSVPYNTANTAPSMYVEGCGMRGEGIYTTPYEVEQAIELMGEDAFIEDYVEDPELLGAFFSKWIKKRKRRKRKMRAKMRGMSKSQRRKYKRKVRRKRMKKITKGMFMRFLPGSRALAAIKLRRKLKGKDTNLMRAWRKKKARKRKAAKARAQRRSIVGPVMPQEQMLIQPTITDEYGPEEVFRQEEEYGPDPMTRQVAPLPPERMIQEVQQDIAPGETEKAGMGKMLPLALGAAAVGFMMMQGGKKKRR